MLHIVNQSPFNRSCLADCLRICDASVSILLIEDGVYAALADGEWMRRILEKAGRIYVLTNDVAARGLTGRIATDAIGVDYEGFVQLCCEHSPVHSWY